MVTRSIVLLALVATASSAFAASGQRPLSPTERSVVEHAIQAQLTDPDSAKFRHNPLQTDAKEYCGLVNAKNRMGGYIGYKLFKTDVVKGAGVIKEISDATIVETDDKDAGMKGLLGMIITSTCAVAGYRVEY